MDEGQGRRWPRPRDRKGANNIFLHGRVLDTWQPPQQRWNRVRIPHPFVEKIGNGIDRVALGSQILNYGLGHIYSSTRSWVGAVPSCRDRKSRCFLTPPSRHLLTRVLAHGSSRSRLKAPASAASCSGPDNFVVARTFKMNS